MTSADPITEAELNAFVDGRLDAARHDQVAAYLDANPDDRTRIARFTRHRAAMRATLASVAEEPVPPQLGIRHLIGMRSRHRIATWRFAAASVLLLLLGAAGGWVLRGQEPRIAETNGIAALAREAAYTYDVFGSDRAHPVEFDAADEDELLKWITERLGRPVAVPDLTASGYKFIGGRLVATPHGPAGLLMYDDGHAHRLAMLVRPMATDIDASMSEHSFGDVRGFAWASGGTGYSLVGATPADLLHPVADAVRRQEAGHL